MVDVLTIAVRIPVVVGGVVIDTVRVWKLLVSVVTPVTVPTAPRLNVTVLYIRVLVLAVVTKPDPVMLMVLAFIARLGGFVELMAGAVVIFATCTALPLLLPFVVTTAERIPATVGAVVKVTVNWVDVAEVIE